MSSGAAEGDGNQAESSSNPGSGSTDSSTVEIRIKTLDSASHTVRVNKDISVPALKEQLQALVGVPVQNQRLICRGRVLKDDQLLSAYNLEDGHTLHLVARPQPQSGDAQAQGDQANAQGQSDANQQGRQGQVTHSLLVGTINVPTVGDGGLPDFNRIVSAVLGSVGNLPGSNGPAGPADMQQGTPLTAPRLGLPMGGNQFQVPADALTTMAIYLSRMEQMFASAQIQPPNQASHQNQQQQTQNQTPSGTSPPPGPPVNRPAFSPAALGGLIRRAQLLLTGQAAVLLNALAGQLENEGILVDVNVRGEVQAAAAWSGTIMQQLGALLMELGRTTMALHMGTAPAEAIVNSGPAVFLSPSGPNPMMVQPMPFPPIGTFPARWPGAPGPRSLNIHIHTSDVGMPPANDNASAVPPTGNEASQMQAQPGLQRETSQENLGDGLDNSHGVPGAVVQETIMVIQDNGDARVLSSRSRNLTPGSSTPPPAVTSTAEGTVGANSSVPMQAASTAQMAQVSQALSQLLPGGLRAPQASQLSAPNPLSSMLGATLSQLAGFQPGNIQVQAPYNPFTSQIPPQGPAPPLAQAQVSIPQQVTSVPPPQPSPGSSMSTVQSQSQSQAIPDPLQPSRNATSTSPEPAAAPTPQPALNPPVGLGLGRLRPLAPRRRTEGPPHADGPRPGSRTPAAAALAAAPPPQSPSENNFASLIGNIIRTPAFSNLAQQMMQTLGEGGSQNVDIGSIMQPMLRSVIQHQQQQQSEQAPEQGTGNQGNDTTAVKEPNTSEALLQKLESGESAEELARSVAEAAATTAGTPLSESELTELASSLTDDYISLISQDLASRI